MKWSPKVTTEWLSSIGVSKGVCAHFWCWNIGLLPLGLHPWHWQSHHDVTEFKYEEEFLLYFQFPPPLHCLLFLFPWLRWRHFPRFSALWKRQHGLHHFILILLPSLHPTSPALLDSYSMHETAFNGIGKLQIDWFLARWYVWLLQRSWNFPAFQQFWKLLPFVLPTTAFARYPLPPLFESIIKPLQQKGKVPENCRICTTTQMVSSKPSYLLRPEPGSQKLMKSAMFMANAASETVASRWKHRPWQACDRAGSLYAQGCVENPITGMTWRSWHPPY